MQVTERSSGVPSPIVAAGREPSGGVATRAPHARDFTSAFRNLEKLLPSRPDRAAPSRTACIGFD